MSGLLSSKPSTSHHSFSNYVLAWWNRALLLPHVPGHTVQVSSDEVSELDLDHPLSASFKQETGPGMCPDGLWVSRGNSFPQNSVHHLCEKSRDKSPWEGDFHQQCQSCEMGQCLCRLTAKTRSFGDHFQFVFFLFKEWLIGKRDETDRLINYKCVTRLHSNLKHSIGIAEKQPDGGEGEEKKSFLWTGDSLTASWIFKETSVKNGLKLPFPCDGSRYSLWARVDYLLC